MITIIAEQYTTKTFQAKLWVIQQLEAEVETLKISQPGGVDAREDVNVALRMPNVGFGLDKVRFIIILYARIYTWALVFWVILAYSLWPMTRPKCFQDVFVDDVL